MPDNEVLKRCWDKNSDGAGIMYRRGDRIQIEKGFMRWSRFRKALATHSFDKDSVVVMHFRIGTSGGNIAENTHPFPLSNKVSELKRLKISTTQAMVHNGILGSGEEKMSDTQVFVRDVLSSKGVKQSLTDIGVRTLIGKHVSGSRILIWDDKVIWRWGSWEEEDGIFYSNTGYKVYVPWSSAYSYKGTHSTLKTGKEVRRNHILQERIKACNTCGYINFGARFLAEGLCPVCLGVDVVDGPGLTVSEIRTLDDEWFAFEIPRGKELGALLDDKEYNEYIKGTPVEKWGNATFYRTDTYRILDGNGRPQPMRGPTSPLKSTAELAKERQTKEKAAKEAELDKAFMDKTLTEDEMAYQMAQSRIENKDGYYLDH